MSLFIRTAQTCSSWLFICSQYLSLVHIRSNSLKSFFFFCRTSFLDKFSLTIISLKYSRPLFTSILLLRLDNYIGLIIKWTSFEDFIKIQESDDRQSFFQIIREQGLDLKKFALTTDTLTGFRSEEKCMGELSESFEFKQLDRKMETIPFTF